MTDQPQRRPLWIDPRLQNLPHRPWRKIHLDFHNSQHVPRIGWAFDPDEFGDQLVAAHVDAIVVFAKDMHGYFYYPSQYGPVHRGLAFDLLGQQVEACRSRHIKVYAYYCATWDNHLAEHHPEWLVFKRDRTTHLPRFDEIPGWTALCLSNPDFVQLMLAHSKEILEAYELDGIWYDMPLPKGGECYCATCLEALRGAGLDPFDVAVQRRHKQQLLTSFMRRAHELAHAIRPGCQVDQNNQTRLGLGARAPYLDNIDIEALPTAFWGYLYYPATVRYARTFGTSVCGMTGRFQGAWADFGGLKHPNQLRVELAGIVAQGAQCDIGDQMPPSGRLDPAVYQTIGPCYAAIQRLEPYLEKAAPVTEAAILVSGLPLDDIGTAHPELAGALGTAVFGWVKLLMELHVQFDVVEVDADNGVDTLDKLNPSLERYRLLVLPDALRVDEALAERLRRYLADGGSVLASHTALRLDGSQQLWPNHLGLSYAGESPYAPAYLKLAGEVLDGLPDYEYALYEGAAQWQPQTDSRSREIWGHLGEPLFQRSPEHYTSHRHTPFDHLTGYAAIVRQDHLAATAFPLGASYYRHGYWIYREVARRLLHSVLPVRLVETNAPISTEVTVTQQAPTAAHPERWMVHLVNYSPARRSPDHCEFLEDPIPLHNIQVSLAVDADVQRAYIAGDGSPLPLQQTQHGWQVTVPQVHTSAIVVFEL